MGNCLSKNQTTGAKKKGITASTVTTQPSKANYLSIVNFSIGTGNVTSSSRRSSKLPTVVAPADPSLLDVRGYSYTDIFFPPGSISGNGITISSCESCNIYVADWSDQVQIDDCVDCRVFVAAAVASVFTRDCKKCDFAIGCQQLRTRDCHSCLFRLACYSKPVIESSKRLWFRPLALWTNANKSSIQPLLNVYDTVSSHMSFWASNQWYNIFDFTRGENEAENHMEVIYSPHIKEGSTLSGLSSFSYPRFVLPRHLFECKEISIEADESDDDFSDIDDDIIESTNSSKKEPPISKLCGAAGARAPGLRHLNPVPIFLPHVGAIDGDSGSGDDGLGLSKPKGTSADVDDVDAVDVLDDEVPPCRVPVLIKTKALTLNIAGELYYSVKNGRTIRIDSVNPDACSKLAIAKRGSSLADFLKTCKNNETYCLVVRGSEDVFFEITKYINSHDELDGAVWVPESSTEADRFIDGS